MCRKHLSASWLIFLSLIFILGWANAYLTGIYDEDSENIIPGDYLGNGPGEEMRFVEKREPSFTPYISVGALSNMQQFFESLKENLDSLEKLPKEEREAFFSKPGHAAAPGNSWTLEAYDWMEMRINVTIIKLNEWGLYDRDDLEEDIRLFRLAGQEKESRAFRPPATAAYLHAIRNQRPSHKIRNFVENAEPLTLRGSNYYDPSYLWSGLGRRR